MRTALREKPMEKEIHKELTNQNSQSEEQVNRGGNEYELPVGVDNSPPTEETVSPDRNILQNNPTEAQDKQSILRKAPPAKETDLLRKQYELEANQKIFEYKQQMSERFNGLETEIRTLTQQLQDKDLAKKEQARRYEELAVSNMHLESMLERLRYQDSDESQELKTIKDLFRQCLSHVDSHPEGLEVAAKTVDQLIMSLARTNPALIVAQAEAERRKQGMWLGAGLALAGVVGGSLILGTSAIAGLGLIGFGVVCAGGTFAIITGKSVSPQEFSSMLDSTRKFFNSLVGKD